MRLCPVCKGIGATPGTETCSACHGVGWLEEPNGSASQAVQAANAEYEAKVDQATAEYELVVRAARDAQRAYIERTQELGKMLEARLRELEGEH